MSNVSYLKKKKMHELAKKLFDLDCNVRLCDCKYSFYRGSERLCLHDNTYFYELYASSGGNYLTSEIFFYDDDGKRVEVSRNILNGFGKREIVIA